MPLAPFFCAGKELHGLRFAGMLGIRNMYEQNFLTAAIQNTGSVSSRRSIFSSVVFSCTKAMLSDENMAFVGGLR